MSDSGDARPGREDGHFRERPDACPLCGEVTTGLDFHHWQYGNSPSFEEVGCYLCRDCHEEIHDRGAKPQDSNNWLMECVAALIELHRERNSSISVEEFSNRYNLPSPGIVQLVYEDPRTEVTASAE